MKKNKKGLLLRVALALTLTHALVLNVKVHAAPADGAPGAAGSPKGVLQKITPRQNKQSNQGEPIRDNAVGVHVFTYTDNTATIVLDETGTTPLSGQVNFVEISSGPVNGTSCYFMIFDSGVASGVTEVGSVNQMLAAPLMAVASQLVHLDFIPPRQFQNGLVGLMDGTCRLAAVGWSRIGGNQ